MNATTRTHQMTTLDALARAAVRIFRPLVRILLRHNVSYKTCAEWLRWCYADVANREFTPPGRKQSKSRVAVLTGLTRIDVNHLLVMPPPHQAHQEEHYHRAGLVLSGWANDSEYQTPQGRMQVLPFESAEDDSPSFSQLVARHSGGAPARAVLDELVLNGAVRVLPDRQVELIRTRYITQTEDIDIDYCQVFGLACGELIETIAHNWQPDQQEKRLQLVVYNRSIHPRLVDEAKKRLETAARELAEQADQWLYEFETRSDEIDQAGPRTERARVGVGIYYFQ